MQKLLWLLTTLCRFGLAGLFIFSGFVKAVDPMGTQYKIEDYATLVGLNQFVANGASLLVAIVLISFEFVLGIFLFFGIRRHTTMFLTLLTAAFLTPLTLYLAIENPIKDCGCFGDAWVISNWATFAKNAILLAASILVFIKRNWIFRLISERNQWIVSMYTVIFVVAFSLYNLYWIPVLDFRPYRIGANLSEGMQIPEGEMQPKFETYFIMEKEGEVREFTLENYPDSTWNFIDRRTVQTAEGYTPPIDNFSIVDLEYGDDLTEDILTDENYTFLLIAPWLDRADDGVADLINELYDYCEAYGYRFYALTSSSDEVIARWKDGTAAAYPFCATDATTLKTMIRSNPGLILLKKGTVINKWGRNGFPDEYKLNGPLDQLELAQLKIQSTWSKIVKIILLYLLPLLLISFIDRLWVGSKYYIMWRKRKKNNLITLRKEDKMRKHVVAGNWKMNKNLQEGLALATELNSVLTAEKPNCDVVICTPYIHLASVAAIVDKNIIGVGAENCADKVSGAYTGEVSAEMIASTGASYCIIGHSERRAYYGETFDILKEKTLLALANNLTPIFCIGELKEEREAGKQNEVVKAQLEGSVFNLSAEEFSKLILAYEPVWAIGTGLTATSDQAEEIHAYIRSLIVEKYGNEIAENLTILYGGSCNAGNASELFGKPNVDGGLIGGASLKVADFKGIIDAWK